MIEMKSIKQLCLAELSGRQLTLANLCGNYLNTACNAIVALVMVPIFLRYLGTEIYGAWIATGNLVNVLVICDLGLNLIITQKMSAAYGSGENRRLSELMGASATVSAVVAALLVLFGWILAGFAPRWVGVHGSRAEPVTAALRYSSAALGLSFLLQNTYGVYQAIRAPIIPVALSLLSLLIGVLTVWWGLLSGQGVVALGESLMMRQLLPLFLAVPLLFWTLKNRRLPLPSGPGGCIRELLGVGFPTLLGRSLGIVASNCQEFVVGSLISVTAAANFSFTKRLPDLCGTILSPIASSAFSTLSAATGDTRRCESIARRLLGLSTLVATWLVGICMVMNRGFVTVWVGPEHYAGTILSVAICVSVLVNARVQLLTLITTSQGLFIGVTIWSAAHSFVLLFALTGLVNWFGTLGLPLATTLSLLLVWGPIFPKLLGRKFHEPMALVWKDIFRSLAGCVLAISVATLLPPLTGVPVVLSVAVVTMVAFGGVLLLVFSDQRKAVAEQVAYLWSLRTKWMRPAGETSI